MNYTLRDIDKTDWRKFRAKAARSGKTAKDLLREMIAAAVKGEK